MTLTVLALALLGTVAEGLPIVVDGKTAAPKDAAAAVFAKDLRFMVELGEIDLSMAVYELGTMQLSQRDRECCFSAREPTIPVREAA